MLALEGPHPSFPLYSHSLFIFTIPQTPWCPQGAQHITDNQNHLLNVETNTTSKKNHRHSRNISFSYYCHIWDALTLSHSFSKYNQRFFFNGEISPVSNTLWVFLYFTLYCQVSLQKSPQMEMINRFHLVCPSRSLVWKAGSPLSSKLHSTFVVLHDVWPGWGLSELPSAYCRSAHPCLQLPQLSLIYCLPLYLSSL